MTKWQKLDIIGLMTERVIKDIHIREYLRALNVLDQIVEEKYRRTSEPKPVALTLEVPTAESADQTLAGLAQPSQQEATSPATTAEPVGVREPALVVADNSSK